MTGDPFDLAVTAVVALSVVAVFVGIAADFALYNDRSDVRAEQRSIVATGTMVLFYLGYLVVIWRRAGYVPGIDAGVRRALAVAGAACVAAGAAINLAGRLSLRHQWANHIKIYGDHRLVTTGVFSVVRHPAVRVADADAARRRPRVCQRARRGADGRRVHPVHDLPRSAGGEGSWRRSSPSTRAIGQERACSSPDCGGEEMASIRPVSIPTGAYAFCRITTAGLAWLAVFTGQVGFLWVDFLLLLASALLGVGRAPLIVAYAQTADRIFRSKPVVVDEKAIRFAHSVGAAISGIALVLFGLGVPIAGWVVTVFLGVLWTSAAFGYCSAVKLYQCTTETGTCCGVGRTVRRVTHVR